MIAWINGRVHLMCNGCFRRWPAPDEDEPDGVHLCDVCRGEPLAGARPTSVPRRRLVRLLRLMT
jgi:hypothetical protein